MKWLGDRLVYILAIALTLGLAPFNPPHIIGKIEWLIGGAVGMKAEDWFDLFFHGIPWVLLVLAGTYKLNQLIKTKKSGD